MSLYDSIGQSYVNYRIPDTRIAELINKALGSSKTVVNVGAGTGSYEPKDRTVLAVEPSDVMIKQRPPGSAHVIQARAENLPFYNKQFDASMAILTIHHWTDWAKGMTELCRVSKKIVLLTWDPNFPGFWLTRDYFPEVLEIDKSIFPPIEKIMSMLRETRIENVPVPHDCTDGFGSAYWRRPTAYLNKGVRNAMSTFSKLGDVENQLQKLRADLESGLWYQKYASVLELKECDLGFRLITGVST